MNEEKFNELVDLYLDREITEADAALLRSELERSDLRREYFESQRCFHQAMRSALRASLNPELSNLEATPPANRILFPLVCLSTLAACVALALVSFGPQFVENKMLASGSDEGIEALDPVLAEEVEISPEQLLRYLEQRELEQRRQATLTAQLRLMGMTPEVLPADRQLQNVDLQAHHKAVAIKQDHTEHLERLVRLSPIPETPVMQSRSMPNYANTGSTWPAGFRSSLASF